MICSLFAYIVMLLMFNLVTLTHITHATIREGRGVGRELEYDDTNSGIEAYQQIIYGDQLPSTFDSERVVTLVGTVDGKIHAMNSENQEVWSTALPGGSLAQSYYYSTDENENENENDGDSDYQERDQTEEEDMYGQVMERKSKSNISATKRSKKPKYTHTRTRRPIAVIPTVDGSIIIHSSEGMRKTSVNAQALIEKAPYASKDGGLVFTGVKHSRLIGLNLDTGAIIMDTSKRVKKSGAGETDQGVENESDQDNVLREEWKPHVRSNKTHTTLSNPSQHSEEGEARGEGSAKNNLQSLLAHKLKGAIGSQTGSTSNNNGNLGRIWVGRTDYTLHAYDERTGKEEFNFTYSEILPINSSGIRVNLNSLRLPADNAKGIGNIPPSSPTSALPVPPAPTKLVNSKSQQDQQLLPLVSTPDGELYFSENSGLSHTHGRNRDRYRDKDAFQYSAYRSVSLGSPATCAFSLHDFRIPGGNGNGNGGGYVEINRRRIVHSIDMGSSATSADVDEDEDESGKNKSRTSASASEQSGATVVVRHHKEGGGLYALEISSPDTSASIDSDRSRNSYSNTGLLSNIPHADMVTIPATTSVRIGKGTAVGVGVDKSLPVLVLDVDGVGIGTDVPSKDDEEGVTNDTDTAIHTGSGETEDQAQALRKISQYVQNRDSCSVLPVQDLTYANSNVNGGEMCTVGPLVGTHRLNTYRSPHITGSDDDDGEGGAIHFLDPRVEVEVDSVTVTYPPLLNSEPSNNNNLSKTTIELEQEQQRPGQRQEWKYPIVVSHLYDIGIWLEKFIVRFAMQVIVFYSLIAVIRRLKIPLPRIAEECIAFMNEKVLLYFIRFLVDAGIDIDSKKLERKAEEGGSAALGEDIVKVVSNSSKSNSSDSITNAEERSHGNDDGYILDENGKQVLQIGSIRMTETVLGYGSQGTIVLKGSLNGRPVAVKRMLSQLHHSAEREIALLIRSDGHPNVVRYFLREKKGEFVYLALQLCRMSLRDFIVRIQKHQSTTGLLLGDETVAAAISPRLLPLTSRDVSDDIKGALLQICKGVAHLHSQRIVHRDIKPHNILCAFPDEALCDELHHLHGDSEPHFIRSVSQLSAYVLKISDMGLSKQLDPGDGSFESMSLSLGPLFGEGSNASSDGGWTQEGGGGGSGKNKQRGAAKNPVGTIGWQAPELLALRDLKVTDAVVCEFEEDEGIANANANANSNGNNTPESDSSLEHPSPDSSEKVITASLPSRSQSNCKKIRLTQMLDIFSLGCVLHYVLVPGEHPFGEWFEREANIIGDKSNLSGLQDVPDALDLIQRMLRRDQRTRPSSQEICDHPFFWTMARRLNFLTDLSDRLEHEPANTDIMQAIEFNATDVVGPLGWDKLLDTELLEDMGKYRRYDTTSVRDLLRVIRNKRHHFYELPEATKALMTPLPTGFQFYFDSLFPALVLHCVRTTCAFLPDDKISEDYCKACVRMFAKDRPVHSRFGGDAGGGAYMQDTRRQRFHRDAGVVSVIVSSPSPSSDSASASADSTTALNSPSTSTVKDSSSRVGSNANANTNVNVGRMWMSIADEWVCEPSVHSLKGLRPSHLNRSSTDAKYRSRLCAHWANSGGTICPMRKKGKCDFAHGPLELRVKESRKDAWIQKAQQLQNNCSKLSNEDPALVMFQSAGEDVLSAARNIEKVRVNAAISASALVNGPENATGNLNMSAFHAAAFAGAISSGSRTPIPVHSSGSGGINGNGNSHLVASTLSPPTSTTLRANGVTFVPKHFSGGVKK